MTNCMGITKDGRSCSRKVREGSSYCWQHKPDQSHITSQGEAGALFISSKHLQTSDTKREESSVLTRKRSLKTAPSGQEDGVYGALALVRSSRLQRITKLELETLVNKWHSTNALPSKITSIELAYEYHGPELSYLDLSGLDLSEMDLRCVKVLHCDLSHTKLNSTKLDGAFLFGCDLSYIDSWNGSFRYTNFGQCYIVSSRFMYGHFEGASLKHSNLEDTKLIGSYHDRDTQYFKTRFHGTSFKEAYLEGADLKEARTLFGVRLYQARIEGAEIDYNLFEGKIGEEVDREFALAAQAYSSIKANLESRGHYADAARAYVKERQMERMASAPWNSRRCYGAKQLGDKYEYSQELSRVTRTQLGARWWNPRSWVFYFRHTVKWMTDLAIELLCSYGENPWRVLFWMFVMLFLLGPVFIYLLGGLNNGGVNLRIYSNDPLQQMRYVYLQYVLYTMDTFTTADFSGLEPANDLVRLTSGFMALLGIFLAGLLGFVAGNRIRHS